MYPLMPSAATVFLTTSIAPLYVPGAAVWSRVLVRSKGCPTRTQEIPPKPPERNDLTGSTVDLASREAASSSFELSDIVLWGKEQSLEVEL